VRFYTVHVGGIRHSNTSYIRLLAEVHTSVDAQTWQVSGSSLFLGLVCSAQKVQYLNGHYYQQNKLDRLGTYMGWWRKMTRRETTISIAARWLLKMGPVSWRHTMHLSQVRRCCANRSTWFHAPRNTFENVVTLNEFQITVTEQDVRVFSLIKHFH